MARNIYSVIDGRLIGRVIGQTDPKSWTYTPITLTSSTINCSGINIFGKDWSKPVVTEPRRSE